jgi:hypothetical protein
LNHPDHPSDDPHSTDENHEIGGKKGHDKGEGIVQPIGGNQEMNSEKQEKEAD